MKKSNKGKNKTYIFWCKSTTLGCVLDEILNVIEYMIQCKYNGAMDRKYILNSYKQMWRNKC